MVRVLVEDKIKPVCQAPANISVTCENFDPTLGTYGAATASDNCCVDTLINTINYNLFDTVCSRGTILRNWRVTDCSGNSGQCSQRVYVDYKQDYYLKMPDDKLVLLRWHRQLRRAEFFQ